MLLALLLSCSLDFTYDERHKTNQFNSVKTVKIEHSETTMRGRDEPIRYNVYAESTVKDFARKRKGQISYLVAEATNQFFIHNNLDRNANRKFAEFNNGTCFSMVPTIKILVIDDNSKNQDIMMGLTHLHGLRHGGINYRHYIVIVANEKDFEKNLVHEVSHYWYKYLCTNKKFDLAFNSKESMDKDEVMAREVTDRYLNR